MAEVITKPKYSGKREFVDVDDEEVDPKRPKTQVIEVNIKSSLLQRILVYILIKSHSLSQVSCTKHQNVRPEYSEVSE